MKKALYKELSILLVIGAMTVLLAVIMTNLAEIKQEKKSKKENGISISLELQLKDLIKRQIEYESRTVENKVVIDSIEKIKGRLQKERETGSPKVLKYLDTHPAIESRIAKAGEASKSFERVEESFNLDWKAVKRVLPSIFDLR